MFVLLMYESQHLSRSSYSANGFNRKGGRYFRGSPAWSYAQDNTVRLALYCSPGFSLGSFQTLEVFSYSCLFHSPLISPFCQCRLDIPPASVTQQGQDIAPSRTRFCCQAGLTQDTEPRTSSQSQIPNGSHHHLIGQSCKILLTNVARVIVL